MGDETHEAWVRVFAAITESPVDTKRAPCPNCGFFEVRFRYVADVQSRVGFCALWCEHCGHGHTLARVRVPDGIDFVPLDARDDVIRAAVPDFYDAALDESEPAAPSPTGSRIAELRPLVAEYELLRSAEAPDELARALLSPRELQVLALIGEGATNAEIARKLAIAPGTVRSHTQRIYWKLGRAADRELREA